MTKPWVRLYRDAILKPKVGKLTLEQLGFWSACLMLSDDDGNLPSTADLAWQLRIEVDIVRLFLLEALISNGLVTRYVTNGVTNYRLHDWDEHQRKSDHDQGGSERQRRFRERQKEQKSAAGNPEQDRNALRDGGVTLSDTDTDTDTEKKEEAREQVRAPNPKSPPVKKTVSRQKGSRWPAEAVVPDEWIGEGEAYRDMANRPPADLRAEALKFANYWAAKSGGGATKIDWKRTWLNWCLTANGGLNGSRTHGKSQLEQLADIIRADQVIDG